MDFWSPLPSQGGQAGLHREGFGFLGRLQGWEPLIVMATSSSRGNKERPNVEQIGKDCLSASWGSKQAG